MRLTGKLFVSHVLLLAPPSLPPPLIKGFTRRGGVTPTTAGQLPPLHAPQEDARAT